MQRKTFVLFLFAFGLITHLSAQTFSAFVSQRSVQMGETFQVSFKLENAQGAGLEYPSFDNFQVLGGPNTSTSMQFINGKMSQSVTYSFYLRPSKVGKFTIGSASIEVNGKKLTTDKISVTVEKGSGSNQGVVQGNPGGSSSGGQASQQRNESLEEQLKDNLFLRAFVSKSDVYQGEQIVITYKMYERVSTHNITPEEPPSYNGFWVENIELKNFVPKNEVYKGVQYRTLIVKKDILFPQRTGKLKIDPMELSCLVQVRRQPRKRRSVFDSFFEQYDNYKYSFSNPPVTINVKSLPSSGKPIDFSGIVGEFTLNASLDKTETETGEPVTLQVKISGKGNVNKIKEPRLDFPPDFDLYDPKISESSSKSGGVLSGRKSFDYLILPRNPGEYKLPTVNFSYFDIKKKSYVTLHSPEYVLNVTGDAQEATMNVTNINKEDVELIGQDIRFIQASTGRIREKGKSFAGSIPFAALYLLPFMLFAGLFIYKKQQEEAAADVAGTKSRKATKVAKKRLSAAEGFMKNQEEKSFYDEVVRAIWGYLGDRLTIPQSELSRDQVRGALEGKNVNTDYIDRLTALIDNCEMALFAPTAISGGMQGTYDEAVRLISDIEGELN